MGVAAQPQPLAWTCPRQPHLGPTRAPAPFSGSRPGVYGTVLREGSSRHGNAAPLRRALSAADRALTRVPRYADRVDPAGHRDHLRQRRRRGPVLSRCSLRRGRPAPSGGKVDRGIRRGHRLDADPALVLASFVMGVLFGLQRRALGGGVEASALTHLTWPVLMLRYLPPLFRRPKTVR